MKICDLLTEDISGSAFHGSFSPNIKKFRPFTHLGSRQAALDRLVQVHTNEPDWQSKTRAYIYTVNLDTSKTALVTDYPNLGDPPGDFKKLVKWIPELKKDPRINSCGGAEQLTDISLRIKARLIPNAQKFIDEFINILRNCGIEGFRYVNQIEDPGQMSYIAFDQNALQVVKQETVNLADLIGK
jgi:hypothetical protein